MNDREMIECSLVKVTSRGNRLSFIFHNSQIKNTPMRTLEIKFGTENKRSLFEVYSQITLGYLPDIDQVSPVEISEKITNKCKGKLFLLGVKPSKCQRYTDILSIRRGSH
jgi:hypothetical protein